ncbi:MAG: aconitase X catalytic domain-containing protein [Desulfovibrionaceae bacterium]|jgi:predicted aconitase|nr:aconitase X catalytic domain-containing protein [Desulfovibrionaceae bacterium]
MKLTDHEKSMLDGEHGAPVQKAMEILVALGKIYDAERLIPIQSAHVAGLSLKSHGVAGMEWVEEMAASAAKVCIPTTLNVIGLDRSRDLGLPEDWCDKQMRIGKAYECMGCYGNSSCVPYYHGFTPRFGEHIAWAESSAVVYTNSVLGARDNREGGPSALAAALTGRTPLYGYHLDAERLANVHVRVSARLRNLADYGALGAFVGKRFSNAVPAFSGLSAMRTEDHVYLGAALASSGGVALYHVLGMTPDALFNDDKVLAKDCIELEVTEKELTMGREQLCSGTSRQIDYVAVGCPHCSLNQLAELARLLDGKKVNSGVTMWIHTNVAIKGLAAQLGIIDAIERSGAVVTQDLCTILSCPEALGFKNVVTNSAKMAFYAPGSNGFNIWFDDVARCVDAAVTGTYTE